MRLANAGGEIRIDPDLVGALLLDIVLNGLLGGVVHLRLLDLKRKLIKSSKDPDSSNRRPPPIKQ